MRVCFFARVRDRRLLERMGFYSDDIQILRDLGCKVTIASKVQDIPFTSDLYFIWWYGWGAVPLLVSKVLNKPSIVVGGVHYEDHKYGYFSNPPYKRAIMRWSAKSANAVLAVSALEYEGIRKLGSRNIHLVYHGVEVPAEVAPWSSRHNIVFSIGHLNRRDSIDRKGFDNVVRAIPLVVKAIPDVHFVMAGTKGGEFFLDELAEELGVVDRITFPGQIDNESRLRYLAESRVLAQPAEWEGFGLAQLEAMAAGLPVVTSDAGAVSEVVGDAGLYCKKGSPADIADKIVHLLKDRDQWEHCSKEGYRRAKERFTLEARKQKIKEIIQALTAPRLQDRREQYESD